MGKRNEPHDVFKYIDTKDNDTTKCWPWLGTKGGRDNRPYVSINGKKHIVPRVVFELFNGPIPEGKVVRHTCDNPECCNPEHLIIGSRSENELDKYKRDRAGYSREMLVEMRRCFRLGMTYKAIKTHIDAKFGTNVSVSGIGDVYRGKRRKDG